jgi:fermentation-respiration switch protein FrsA (DUF1100 family)
MGGEEPWAYYGTARSAVEGWVNQITRGSLHSLMTFDALAAADPLGATPLLMVHGRADDYCSPELAAELYERSPGPRRWFGLTPSSTSTFTTSSPGSVRRRGHGEPPARFV